ncbi:Calx-beta domain-containing protein [Patescibacteria group bacterium]
MCKNKRWPGFGFKFLAVLVLFGICFLGVSLDTDASIDGCILEFVSTSSVGLESEYAVLALDIINSPTEDVTLHYNILPGTAASGIDFWVTDSLTIPAGATEAEISIQLVQDEGVEANEFFRVELLEIGDLTIGQNSEHTFTIIDDDTEQIYFSEVSATASESAGESSVDIAISQYQEQNINVNFEILGTSTATFGVDFVIGSGSALLRAGEPSVSLPINILSDYYIEADEIINIELTSLTNGGDVIINEALSMHELTISNDDLFPAIEFVQVSSSGEEGQQANLSLRLYDAPEANTTLNYSLSSANAVNGADYIGSNSITVPAGATSVDLPLQTIEDLDSEGDESVVVTLRDSAGLSLASNKTHTYTIIDNEGLNGNGHHSQVDGATDEPEREPVIAAISGYGEPTHVQLYTKHGDTIGPDISGLFPSNYLGGAAIVPIDADNSGIKDQVIFFARRNGGPQVRMGQFDRDGNFNLQGQMFVFDQYIRDGLSAVVADFDNDGYEDDAAFAITGDFAPTIRVYKDIQGVDNWELLSEFTAPFGNVGANLGAFQYDDGPAEVLVSPNHGPSDPNVNIMGVDGSLKTQFPVYGSGVINGVTPSGIGERIYVTPNNGSSQINVYNKQGERTNFKWAYQKHVIGDFMNVPGDIDGDGVDEILISPVGGVVGPQILSFEPSMKERSFPRFFAFSETKRNGVGIGVVMMEK